MLDNAQYVYTTHPWPVIIWYVVGWFTLLNTWRGHVSRRHLKRRVDEKSMPHWDGSYNFQWSSKGDLAKLGRNVLTALYTLKNLQRLNRCLPTPWDKHTICHLEEYNSKITLTAWSDHFIIVLFMSFLTRITHSPELRLLSIRVLLRIVKLDDTERQTHLTTTWLNLLPFENVDYLDKSSNARHHAAVRNLKKKLPSNEIQPNLCVIAELQLTWESRRWRRRRGLKIRCAGIMSLHMVS